MDCKKARLRMNLIFKQGLPLSDYLAAFNFER